MFRHSFTSLAILGSLIGLAGCNEELDPTDQPTQYVWEARDITSSIPGLAEFNAQAYIVSVNGLVDTGIRLTDAVFGTQYGWLIRLGSCGSSGPLLTSDPTAFPIFSIGSNGEGAVAKAVFGLLEGDEQFYVEIYVNPESSPTLVGCGEMNRIIGLPNF